MACLLDADDPALLGLVFLFVRNLSMGRMKGNFVLVCFLALRSTNYYGVVYGGPFATTKYLKK